MSRDDEDYLFECIEQIQKKVDRNNKMLCQIVEVINVYLANHHQENEDDFMRNIMANLISNMVELKKIK